MDSSVVQTLKTAETIGQAQYDAFVQERLVLCEKPLTDIIPKSNLSLFGAAPKKVQSRSQHQVASLKANYALPSRLYISCQSCSGNLTSFSPMKTRPANINLKHGKSATLHKVRSCVMPTTNNARPSSSWL